jgi:hypothetical protein
MADDDVWIEPIPSRSMSLDKAAPSSEDGIDVEAGPAGPVA